MLPWPGSPAFVAAVSPPAGRFLLSAMPTALAVLRAPLLSATRLSEVRTLRAPFEWQIIDGSVRTVPIRVNFLHWAWITLFSLCVDPATCAIAARSW